MFIFAPNPAYVLDLSSKFPLIITESMTERLIITDSIKRLISVTKMK